ncbi:MAG: hypothetical protein KGS72_11855 [Cyanobacteria bacterium REEB67]|nr:hypothetical protein [Cyanobacteria bacterium REEB67]
MNDTEGGASLRFRLTTLVSGFGIVNVETFQLCLKIKRAVTAGMTTRS